MADNSVLSLLDMDEISAELDVLRPNTCIVSRPTGEVDEAGANTGNYDTQGSYGCRIDEGIGGMPWSRVFGPAVISQASAIISFARGVSIRAHDLIEERGRLFRVIYVPDPSYSFETSVAVSSATSRNQGGGVRR